MKWVNNSLEFILPLVALHGYPSGCFASTRFVQKYCNVYGQPLKFYLPVPLGIAAVVVQSSIYDVPGGYRAVMFDRFSGVKNTVEAHSFHAYRRVSHWVHRPLMKAHISWFPGSSEPSYTTVA